MTTAHLPRLANPIPVYAADDPVETARLAEASKMQVRLTAAQANGDYELAFLGQVVRFGDYEVPRSAAARKALDLVQSGDFSERENQSFYRALRAIVEDDRPFGSMALVGELVRHFGTDEAGQEAAKQAINHWVLRVRPWAETSTPLPAEEYADVITRLAMNRDLLSSCMTAMQYVGREGETPQQVAARLKSSIENVITRGGGNDDTSLAGAVESVIEDLLSGQKADRLAFGLTEVDGLLLGGIDKGSLTTIAGRTGMGKSMVAFTIAVNLARRGKRVLYVSGEMSKKQVVERLLARMTGVPLSDIVAGGDWSQATGVGIKESDKSEITAKMGVVQEVIESIAFLRGRKSAAQIEAVAIELIAKGGLDVVIVDNLGHVVPTARAEKGIREKFADNSGEMKDLAIRLDVPVIQLAQIGRAGIKADKDADRKKVVAAPGLEDIKESGTIEEDSDYVLILHREDYYDRESRPYELDVHVLKNRQGPTGVALLADRRIYGYVADMADNNGRMQPARLFPRD